MTVSKPHRKPLAIPNLCDSPLLFLSDSFITRDHAVEIAQRIAVIDFLPLARAPANSLLVERPQIPAPTGEGHEGKIVAALGKRGNAPEVRCKRRIGLGFGKLAAHGEGAEIVRVIGHAGILPVDKVHAVGSVNENIQVEEVVVRDAHGRTIGVREGGDAIRLRSELVITGHRNRSQLAQKRVVAHPLFVEVECAGKARAAFVKRARHAHRASDLLGVVRIELATVHEKAGKLPALLDVFVNEGAVEPDRARELQRLDLGLAVDEVFGSHTRLSIHVFTLWRGEMPRLVCQTLFEGPDVGNLVARDFQHR